MTAAFICSKVMDFTFLVGKGNSFLWAFTFFNQFVYCLEKNNSCALDFFALLKILVIIATTLIVYALVNFFSQNLK